MIIDVRLPPKSERLRPHRLRGWLVYPDPANEPDTCFGDPEGDEGLTIEDAQNALDWCDVNRGKRWQQRKQSTAQASENIWAGQSRRGYEPQTERRPTS
jgi:hypothetical protein